MDHNVYTETITVEVAEQSSAAVARLLEQIAQITQKLESPNRTHVQVQTSQATQELNKVHGILQTLAKGVEIPLKIAANAASHLASGIKDAFSNALSALPGPVQQVLQFGFSPLGVVAAGGMATKLAADWQAQQAFVQNNTNMSAASIAALSQQAQTLARQFGGDRSAILQGGMRAMNISGDASLDFRHHAASG